MSPIVLALLAFASSPPEQESSDPPNPATVIAASVGLAAGVVIVGRIAWWDQGTQPFHFIREGYWGAGTYAGGADKNGHLFSSYVSTRAMAAVYRGLGFDRTTSAWMAVGFTFALWNGFEIFGDGFTQYGASPEDMSMNLIGISLAGLFELVPGLFDIFGLRIGYVPTRDFLAHDHTPLKLINDYSGMLYYYDVKLKGLLE